MSNIKKSVFPIKTATACQLKWTWTTLYLSEGTTSSCHRTGRHPISLENFQNFHNTPEKLDQRKIMLKGEWPQPLPYMNPEEGCRYCQKIEEAGGQSDRQFHFQIPGLVPPELEETPDAIQVTPRILEVLLSNTCNLACTYCAPKNSSQIEAENIKFGRFEKNTLIIEPKYYDKDRNKLYIEQFFIWLEHNSSVLRRLHLLGGEPLYQKEFYRCLDFFKNNPNPELELNVVSNLMIDTEKFRDVVQGWKEMTKKRQIKRFDVTVSLDCWGPEQEYARYGLKIPQIEKNMQILLENPWIYLNVNSTLSPLTLRSFPTIIEKLKEWKQKRKINHHFQTVFSPAYHNPDIFGGEFWKQDLENSVNAMPTNNWQEETMRLSLIGIQGQILNSCIKPEKIIQLHTHLDELDRRRGTNWRKLFPHLEDYQKYVV